jgi:hypothetical protein
MRRRGHLQAPFKSRVGRGQLVRNVLAAFGLSWLAVEPAAFFLGGGNGRLGWTGYFVLLAVAGLAGYLRSLPRLPLKRSLAGSKVMVRIAEGDLLDQTGNLIVGTNDFFDTTTAGGVISPASLQGLVAARLYDGDLPSFDQAIADSLALSRETGEVVGEKEYGKKVRYPIGTTAVVDRGPRRVFLVAYGRMPKALPVRVSVDRADFHHALIALWDQVRDRGQREALHVPILGGNFARFHGTLTQLVQTIVLSFIGAQGPAEVSPVLTMWLRPEDTLRVDLPALAVWLDSVCGR